jgi:hypothetical protein
LLAAPHQSTSSCTHDWQATACCNAAAALMQQGLAVHPTRVRLSSESLRGYLAVHTTGCTCMATCMAVVRRCNMRCAACAPLCVAILQYRKLPCPTRALVPHISCAPLATRSTGPQRGAPFSVLRLSVRCASAQVDKAACGAACVCLHSTSELATPADALSRPTSTRPLGHGVHAM